MELHAAFASDERFVLQLQVAALSLIKAFNARSNLYIHILDCNINDVTYEAICARLAAFADKLHKKVFVRRHKVSLESFSGFRIWNSSLATYARLILPEFLTGVKYCLYADCDVLFIEDPTELMRQAESAGKMIIGHSNPRGLDGSVMDFGWLDKVGEPYNQDLYICAGLVVMDLDKFLETRAVADIMNFLRRHPDSVSADQSAINWRCRNDMANFCGGWGLFPLECFGKNVHRISAIHYSGGCPWKRLSWYEHFLWHRLDDIWREFCKKTMGKRIPQQSLRTRLEAGVISLASRILLALKIPVARKRMFLEIAAKVISCHRAVDEARKAILSDLP